MKTLVSIVAIVLLCGSAEAAHRFVRCGDCVLRERGPARVLAHRVTQFGSTVRVGRALGGGPRGFSANVR